MSDLLKKQQDLFKEQVDELYFIQKKLEERVLEFTAKQSELLEKSEKHLNEIQNDISTRLQNEAYEFKKAREWIQEDRAWNKGRTLGFYTLCIIVLITSLINMWVIYNDATRRPNELYAMYRKPVQGKYVIIEPDSIKKKEINGKEYTFARVKLLP